MSQSQENAAPTSRDDEVMAKLDEILALLRRLVDALGAKSPGEGLGH